MPSKQHLRPVALAAMALFLAFPAAHAQTKDGGRSAPRVHEAENLGGGVSLAATDTTSAEASAQSGDVVTLPGPAEPSPNSGAASSKNAGAATRPDLEGPVDEPPILRREKQPLPPDMTYESALFLQRRLGIWTHVDSHKVLGEALRHRPSYGKDKAINGEIFTYSDPTKRYKEFELDFDKETGLLRTVFVYPWKMTWQECRRLWGGKVSATEAKKGRTFYSYVDRRLDVLVERDGNVVSIGLY